MRRKVASDTPTSPCADRAVQVELLNVGPKGNATGPDYGDYPPNAIMPAAHGCTQKLYTYTPLMGKEIRLLCLRSPLNETKQIQADLVHVSISAAQAHNYVALSYTWGSWEASVLITIDDKPFKIRPNVCRILQTLHRLGYRYIWVRLLHEEVLCSYSPIAIG